MCEELYRLHLTSIRSPTFDFFWKKKKNERTNNAVGLACHLFFFLWCIWPYYCTCITCVYHPTMCSSTWAPTLITDKYYPKEASEGSLLCWGPKVEERKKLGLKSISSALLLSINHTSSNNGRERWRNQSRRPWTWSTPRFSLHIGLKHDKTSINVIMWVKLQT